MTKPLPELSIVPSAPGALSAEGRLAGDEVALKIAGHGDIAQAKMVGDLLQRAHSIALRSHVKRVAVDFRELNFMSSACFKQFVSWMSQIDALPKEDQYRVHITSSPAQRWQRTSLTALTCFAIGVMTFE